MIKQELCYFQSVWYRGKSVPYSMLIRTANQSIGANPYISASDMRVNVLAKINLLTTRRLQFYLLNTYNI